MSGQWHPDPTGRHQLRYWDGSAWTDHVSNGGATSTDPLHPIVVPVTPAVVTTPTASPGWGAPVVATPSPVGAQAAQPTDGTVGDGLPGKPDKVSVFDRVKRGKSAFDAVRLTGTVEELRAEYDELAALLVETRDAILLQEVGLYEYRHPLDESTAYKAALDQTRARLQSLVRAGHAVISPAELAG